jgi:hypothetical protein
MLGRRWLCWIVGSATLAERAAAILRDEIEHGALGNIATASRCGRRIIVISSLRRRRAGWRPSSAGCWTPCSTFSRRRHGQRPPRRCHHGRRADMLQSRAANDRALARPARAALRAHSAALPKFTPSAERRPDPCLRSVSCGAIWSPNPMAASMRAAFGSCPAEYEVPPGACVDLAIGLECPTTRGQGSITRCSRPPIVSGCARC